MAVLVEAWTFDVLEVGQSIQDDTPLSQIDSGIFEEIV